MPDDAAKKLVEDAAARIPPAAQAIEGKKAALEAAQKALNEATSARNAAQSRLDQLKAAAKRWSAAAINTRLLNARVSAETTSAKTEESRLAFTQAAEKVAKQAEILNQKRNERAQLAARADTPEWSAETRAELAATLAAIDIMIARELEAYQAAEAGFNELSRALDPATRQAIETQAEADALQQAYHEALK
jgi:hypothetical protein